MKLAVIAPHNPELAAMGDVEFVLAQEVVERDNVGYYAEVADEGREIILDNGAFELGSPALSNCDYLDLAEAIGASIVIAPDIQWNPSESYSSALAFADHFTEAGYNTSEMELMAVVWCAGPGDFGYWFGKYHFDIRPDYYGIGKWLESQYMNGTREQLIRGILQNFPDVNSEMLHALGCPYAHEVYTLRHLVRSMDSGIAVKAALQLAPIYLSYQKYLRIPHVPLKELDVVRLSFARNNVEYLLQLAHMS